MQGFDCTDLEPIRLPFTHDGRRYVLCEATEGDVEAWRSFKWADAKVSDDGTVEDMKRERLLQSGSFLVSLCLHHAGREDIPEARVSLENVLALPARLVDKLILKAMEISDLLAKEDQATLEKAFAEVAGKLIALSDNTGEKEQWRDWMQDEVQRLSVAVVPRGLEAPSKNGPPPATPCISA